jgi:hypothetical protein
MGDGALTIRYEIKMLRHCNKALDGKRKAYDQQRSEDTKAEFDLCIEGFLLHLRNLLAFFTGRADLDSDLTINRPQLWAGKVISQREYSGLMKAAKKVDKKHGDGKDTCTTLISRHLHHCTTYRYKGAIGWNAEAIFADIDPILQEFEQHFAEILSKT